MNKFRFVAIAIVISWVCFYAPTLYAEGNEPKGNSNSVAEIVTAEMILDADIENRLIQMSGLVDLRYTQAVKNSIKQYLRNEKWTHRILKRSSMYFPLMDQYLMEENMPIELKYLAIVESGLNPRARSKAGAVGLWQFMRPTGRMMGLKINRTVDQRSDPNLSTKAAIQYLRQLHDKFGDWGLALAAYNSGPGRVASAIKKAKSNNFWDVKKFLPKETRNYIPAFIAVSYMMNYYHLHDITPEQEDTDLVYTSSTLVYEKMTLKEISEMSGSSMKTIKALNPSYLKGYIPTTQKGNFLILPQEPMVDFFRTLYGDDFIKEINRDERPVVWIELNPIFNPSTINSKISKVVEKLPLASVSNCPSKKDSPIDLVSVRVSLNRFRGKKVKYYRLKKRESLTDIVRANKDISLEDLLSWNNFDQKNQPKPGMIIRIIE